MATLDFTKILTLSDLATAATAAGMSFALDEAVSPRKAAQAVVVSILARFISVNVPAEALGGEKTTASSKNLIVVAAINAAVAAGLKRKVLKAAITGMSADLLADRVFTMLSLDDTVLIGAKS